MPAFEPVPWISARCRSTALWLIPNSRAHRHRVTPVHRRNLAGCPSCLASLRRDRSCAHPSLATAVAPHGHVLCLKIECCQRRAEKTSPSNARRRNAEAKRTTATCLLLSRETGWRASDAQQRRAETHSHPSSVGSYWAPTTPVAQFRKCSFAASVWNVRRVAAAHAGFVTTGEGHECSQMKVAAVVGKQKSSGGTTPVSLLCY